MRFNTIFIIWQWLTFWATLYTAIRLPLWIYIDEDVHSLCISTDIRTKTPLDGICCRRRSI